MASSLIGYLTRSLTILAFSVAVLMTSTAPGLANKYASLIMDADTGAVMHARHASSKRHPASLTKIMTLYMVFDAVERGALTLDQRLPVSRRAAGMPASKLGLKRGQTITVRDAILALVTKSANDAAVVVAEALGGTEIDFARDMTQRARAIGMKNTTFRNASGLYNRRQKSTARDMATLALRIRADFPGYYNLFSRQKFTYRGKTYKNHNNLLAQYKGSDGIKTGYIGAAGFNLVASVERNGRRMIGVVFGGRSAKSRDRHMIKLLDDAYRRSGAVAIRAPISSKTRLALAAAEERTRLATVATAAPTAPRAPSTAVAPEVANPFDLLESDRAAAPPAPFTTRIAEALASVERQGGAPSQRVALGRRLSTTSETLVAALAAEQGATAIRAPLPAAPAPKRVEQGAWLVQVGAFRSVTRARRAAESARDALGPLWTHTEVVLAPTRNTSRKLYRSRLSGLTKTDAQSACKILKTARIDCVPFAPARNAQLAERQ